MAAVVFAASVTSVSAQADATGMGTWKLNVEISKFGAGPALRSSTVKCEPAGNGVKVSVENVAADGSKSMREYTASYDGKDVPLEGSAMADTTSLAPKDAQTTVLIDKRAGKAAMTCTRVVAKDGKSATVAIKGTGAKAEAIDALLAFDKP